MAQSADSELGSRLDNPREEYTLGGGRKKACARRPPLLFVVKIDGYDTKVEKKMGRENDLKAKLLDVTLPDCELSIHSSHALLGSENFSQEIPQDFISRRMEFQLRQSSHAHSISSAVDYPAIRFVHRLNI